ncbi:hypothetical protein Bca52824_026922 [Brassica carinata]|uniref:Uncharacterized protein n=1 Tax=Brassica carinata TaxID=52824 RepID=A0A8X7SHJ1_BRACI|nr:hypothetical protein Bca52824_026922 [Brassica carinata]
MQSKAAKTQFWWAIMGRDMNDPLASYVSWGHTQMVIREWRRPDSTLKGMNSLEGECSVEMVSWKIKGRDVGATHGEILSILESIGANQHGVQNALKISTEVPDFHCTGQTDRRVYWTVLHASGRELWLEPWPDDRFDRTGICLHRPVFYFMKNSRDESHSTHQS